MAHWVDLVYDPEKALEKVDLDLEIYFEKWQGVRKTNAAILNQIDVVLMVKTIEQPDKPRALKYPQG